MQEELPNCESFKPLMCSLFGLGHLLGHIFLLSIESSLLFCFVLFCFDVLFTLTETLSCPSDAVWLLAPSGRLQVQEVLRKLPEDAPLRYPHPSPLPRFPRPADILAASSCRVDPSGLHQGHDSQTPLPEAQGRGKPSLYLLLLLISCC